MKARVHQPGLRLARLIALIGFALVVVLLAPFAGQEVISLTEAFGFGGGESRIFWDLRVPRVLTGFAAGAGLALSGMAFQALFRNPLATPFTLGVSSGASLGVAIYIRLGLTVGLLGIAGTSMAAFLGALFALSLVYGLTQLRHGFSSATLLLAGVAVSFSFSSLILFVQYLSGQQDSFRIVRMLMGSLDVVGYQPLRSVGLFVLAGSLVLLYLTHELNLLSTGEELAASRGANVTRLKKLVFVTVSLMVGGVVAVCGPIGFVGMMVPHACRLMIGQDHRFLAPATIMTGGGFLVLCDTVARVAIPPAEIPVGVLTALLGGPFFLWLLLTRNV